jgi:two-component system nitrate/nitrite response regulator NarL
MSFNSPDIKILLVDDHKLIIQAYSSLLNEVAHFDIIGSASNGREALNLLNDLRADVILLDASMPVMNGYETLKAIRRRQSHVKVIVLTMYTEPAFIFNYLLSGANAFLGKNCERQELITAINTVATEDYYFSSTVSKHIISRTLNDPKFKENYRQLRLTERETDILRLICNDLPNEDIARLLNLSANTIKFFRKNIYRKTNTNTIIGLIKYAIRHGIFAVEQ